MSLSKVPRNEICFFLFICENYSLFLTNTKIFNLNFFQGISLDRNESYFEDLRSIEDILDQISDTYLNLEPEKVRTSEIVPAKNQAKADLDKGWNSISSLITEGFGLLALAAQAFDVEK